jgi:aerobic-type carbon monoxide dehydrogenase small subunit (CoxS/CutS family)
MPDRITLMVNGTAVEVTPGASVAAAISIAGQPVFRHSVSGAPRAPLCGMGICFECRVTVNGRPNVRSCLLLARDGMMVATT